jgi:site-specific recombinase XerC
MARLFRPTYPDKKTGKIKRLKRWYGKYRAASGRIQKVPLSTNKSAAQHMLGELLALVALRSRGMSAKAANHYLTALQQFTRWLVQTKRAVDDPLAELGPANAEADRRRERRVLSIEELRRIISTASASAKTFRGLAGRDRAALYTAAIGTGFRAEELSKLTPGHFLLAADNPHVYLSAAETKNGKSVEQPLPRMSRPNSAPTSSIAPSGRRSGRGRGGRGRWT